MQKTLGGDRLGAGKKMQVELHNYERSTHDLGYLWRSSMSSGTLVPFLCEVGKPGDTFDIHLNCDIKTLPTIGPLFGSYKVQLDVFLCPIRLYQAQLHNNKLRIGMKMSDIKLPVIKLDAKPFQPAISDVDNQQINPSCLLAYLGIRGVGNVQTETPCYRYFNACAILSYWDIYKNYYANKQEEKGAVMHTLIPTLLTTIDAVTVDAAAPGMTIEQSGTPTDPVPYVTSSSQFHITYTGTPTAPEQVQLWTSTGLRVPLTELVDLINTGTEYTGYWNQTKYGIVGIINWDYQDARELPGYAPIVLLFDLNNLDTMREKILAAIETTTPFIINTPDLEPYTMLTGSTGQYNTMMASQQGLGIKTYQSDLFNNWLSTEWIDGTGGINDITAIDTSGGSFNIDTLMLSRKVYDFLMRVAVSGGSYDDWQDAAYTHERIAAPETPIYCGGLSKELVFQEVINNSEAQTESGAQPLGTLAGKGVMGNKHKGGDVIVKVNEMSYLIGLVSLTPRIDYSQGNKWDVNLQTMDDFHKPALDQIGFQELITEQMHYATTVAESLVGDIGVWVQKSAGKQPAWINYMTNVNRTYGDFAIATNSMFMTLNRRYEFDQGDQDIVDLTTYIDPAKYNQIFAQTKLDSQNFWTQISVDMIKRTKMSAKLMPNL